ncbi:MAG: aminotransferase class V-fold PLP-dependent enzyme [Oscillospiraceae bacterium]|nr:aminotransferase class V-fold PLP-dependent enzyme [Oscillospiraceae bacterium]
MTTPICDFVKKYAEKQTVRLHMPGHKGRDCLGFEHMDITEIDGADSLYEAEGIIAQSEANAAELFGCDTFYSAEGSSQCIRAMLYLVCISAAADKGRPLVMAARNAHKTFVSAAALMDFDVEWIYGEHSSSYLSCDISAEYLDSLLTRSARKPAAVYLTSPDYLGNVVDIKNISQVCHKHGVLLIVDNAHGAYLKFLPQSQHPIDLGADLCCDSAHKTLPVLTGGAYLHISDNVSQNMSVMAKNALVMFGSTSPSYLIMQSLDMANRYIADGYREKLAVLSDRTDKIKCELKRCGFELLGDEKLKLTISTKAYGYRGFELAQLLAEKGIVCEFSDPDYIVFMFTPETDDKQLEYFVRTLCSIPPKKAVTEVPPKFSSPQTVMSVRRAAFSECEKVAAEDAEGRILASATVGCPPAVPVVVCGEKIDKAAVECFKYYGIDSCWVVK